MREKGRKRRMWGSEGYKQERKSGWNGWEKYDIQFYTNNSKEYHI